MGKNHPQNPVREFLRLSKTDRKNQSKLEEVIPQCVKHFQIKRF